MIDTLGTLAVSLALYGVWVLVRLSSAGRYLPLDRAIDETFDGPAR